MSRPPHGFNEDAATRRLLRSRPPAAALAWVESVAGGPVEAVRALRGGLSSSVHLVTVAGERMVLRRYVRPETPVDDPGIADHEARALDFVAQLPIPTPRLLATDLAGEDTGVPTILMSWLPGRVTWSPSNMDDWLRGMANLLPTVHATPLPAPGVIRPFATYRQRSYDPPPWARSPAVWRRGVEIAHGPVPGADHVFLHRDFHPGNVLWRRGRVSGLVDWQAASIGPAGVDVGHCRANLLSYGTEVADSFTTLWERASGRHYDPWADVSTIIGWLDGLRDEPPAGYPAFEETLARAVAELHG
ncbi:MAG TPA: aminoglycoside phosphotransferase family protein [Pseudonocardiaceae bacterium]